MVAGADFSAFLAFGFGECAFALLVAPGLSMSTSKNAECDFVDLSYPVSMTEPWSIPLVFKNAAIAFATALRSAGVFRHETFASKIRVRVRLS